MVVHFRIMTRQSITFSKGNSDWLDEKANLIDYGSRSEFINALVRRERSRQKQLSWLSEELEKGYNSPMVGSTTVEEIKASVLNERKRAG